MAFPDRLTASRARPYVRAGEDVTEVVDDPADETLVADAPSLDDAPIDEPVEIETPGPSGRHLLRRNRREAERTPRRPIFEPARRPGRRVTRVVRRVQLWSVFKIALFGSLICYTIFLLAVAAGWSLANSTGQVHHIEKFMRDIGFDNWSFEGPKLFKASVFAGAVGVVAGTIMLTLAAAITNLISELTGGIRFTVLEVDEDDEDEIDDLPG